VSLKLTEQAYVTVQPPAPRRAGASGMVA